MLVMDKTDSMVEVAKFYLKFCVDESCGKCAPCRIGGYQLLQILDRISRGRSSAGDLALIQRICQAMQKASLCGAGLPHFGQTMEPSSQLVVPRRRGRA